MLMEATPVPKHLPTIGWREWAGLPDLGIGAIQAELQAGQGTIGLLGGLHGSFASMPDDLVDLSGIDLGGGAVNEDYLVLGKLGTGEQKYLPWMQATYLMAANK